MGLNIGSTWKGMTLTEPKKTQTLCPEVSEIMAAPMPANRAEWEQRLLEHPKLLRNIADTIGGPFHIVYPDQVVQNIRAFQDVFTRMNVAGGIYYGKKANKSPCIIRACVEARAGVDVASVEEFKATLQEGVYGADIIVTGPSKRPDLLELAARNEALITIDEIGELTRLVATGLSARVLLRVVPAESNSRFGMTTQELDQALTLINPKSIRLEGFSFHLSGYEAKERTDLAAGLISRCLAARNLGHPADRISIGGGFGVDYVPEKDWNAFKTGMSPLWFHGDHTPASFYPYHFQIPGPAMLEEILSRRRLAEQLRDKRIRLLIEPGRALLDQAGSTVFRVQGVKTRVAHGHDYLLLTVDGTSLSLSEQWFESEFLPDPVLVPVRDGDRTPTSVGGCTCLESDMLSWRRIPLPRAAIEGDLLMYSNTAGYQMDSNESAFHELPIPPKVILRRVDGERARNDSRDRNHLSSGERYFEWGLDSPSLRNTRMTHQRISAIARRLAIPRD